LVPSGQPAVLDDESWGGQTVTDLGVIALYWSSAVTALTIAASVWTGRVA